MVEKYRLHPVTDTRIAEKTYKGYEEILEVIEEYGIKDNILICDIYPGIPEESVIEGFSPMKPSLIIRMSDLLRSKEENEKFFEDYITGDRVFGFMCHRDIQCCFDSERLEKAKEAVEAENRLVIIVGTGASLVSRKGTLLYFDITRWEIQLKYRNGMANWLFDNEQEEISRKVKRGYFIEWRIADRHKISIKDRIKWYIAADDGNSPSMVTASAFFKALKNITSQPFRMEPYFDPGVWGGQWMKKTFSLPEESANYAWSFDGVPEENALLLSFGDTPVIKTPAINVVLFQPERLLGEHVYGRYGAEFPIRFDILDTMEGENLSLQVHPITGYIQNEFGMNYTQDESYYILADSEISSVYLGLKTDVDKNEMENDLRKAESGEKIFNAEKYVNKFRARRHDHFLIPAGTVHCSGAGTVVLEISATPYIFTFKLWDWGRLGLDGKPRPIYINHGMKNIQWNRDTDWVRKNLIGQRTVIHEDEDYTACITGLHKLEPIETILYTIRGKAEIDTADSVNMLNLTEGRKAIIKSPDGNFPPFEVYYAETFIVPAAIGHYTIESGDEEIKVIAARIRL